MGCKTQRFESMRQSKPNQSQCESDQYENFVFQGFNKINFHEKS